MHGPMTDVASVLLVGLPILALAGINVYGVWLLRRYGAYARFVATGDLDSVVPAHDPHGLERLAREFRHPHYLALLEQVMNSVGTCEAGPSADPLRALDHARRGGGLACAGMAILYFNVLRLNGITARQVYLSRTCFDTLDTHVTVEVLRDGKWIIADPTFHVGFEMRGELMGAQAIAHSLRDGSLEEIRSRFYGPVRYPVRLDSYYLPWSFLFQNVFVVDRDQPSVPLWARLPPFRYWRGPVMYFQEDAKVSSQHLRCQERLYLLFVVLLPLTLVALFSLALIVGLLRLSGS